MFNLTQFCRALAFAALLAPSAASAQSLDDVVDLDLLDGWTTTEGTHIVGLRIRLAPGWKTYWRSPGESGVPPIFDWSAAQNLQGVRYLWPRPQVFEQNGLRSIGYHDELVLPLELFARDPAAPIVLAGEMELGVCKDICIPMTLDMSGLTTTPGSRDGTGSQPIRQALAARPKTAVEAGAGPVTCAVSPIADGLRLTTSIPVARQGGDEMVVLEPGRADLWVSQPATQRRNGILTAAADLVPPEARPFTFDRSKLRITVIGRDGAVDLLGCQAG
ncbi:protein-disulfide reductase DsbD domain-containing protein [Pseudoruegeria sp. SK021]|uniref:protein-disulfide reductase DsbD domain-containing protein n=1 Tax=Pseudoruegeria sp. SK021 TaxID=1933035 RepID=UPI000A265A2C|nr:protein-disulfide reductase DsbD domain-containing protein [Pseudoruegeria sp. SK021]OSP55668.1 hypothetical protein BV911_06030 [Pseudoruegeria sp. SK021]